MTTASEPSEVPAKKRVGRPPGSKDPRQIFRDALRKGITQRRVDEIVNEAFESTIPVDAECPDCGSTMRARAPDRKKQVDLLIALLEQAEGRPEQRAPGELQVVIERAGR